MDDFNSGPLNHTARSSETIHHEEIFSLILQLNSMLDHLSAHIEPDDSAMIYALCMLSNYSDLLLEYKNIQTTCLSLHTFTN